MNEKRKKQKMNKQFVPKEIAKELKELGFNEPCLAWWFENGSVSVPTEGRTFWSDWNVNPMRISAPLWQQVFDWIREKYKYMHVIEDIAVCAGEKEGYRFRFSFWKILDIYNWCYVDDTPLGYLTYEDAMAACIKRIIVEIKKPVRKSYDNMTLEELEIELQEVWDKGDNTEEEFNMLIVPLENRIKTIVRGLPKPKITDNEAWWCGRNKIMSFTSWQDALAYWDRFQIKQDVVAMDANVLKRKIFPSESDFYFKD
jgi:hypothetical protein